MKDLALFGLFILFIIGSRMAEDYREERCATHGGHWIEKPGCEPDRCDYSKASP